MKENFERTGMNTTRHADAKCSDVNENISGQLKQCATTEEYLKLLRTFLQGKLPRVKSLWGGADVVIRFRKSPENGGKGHRLFNFYPPPKTVATRHARELSWLFEALRDAFYLESLVDGCSKIEFFGRLANAANRKIAENPDVSANELCCAVYNEAAVMYSQIKQHEFKFLLVSFGGEIADDRAHRSKE